jgi:hypothetical protein
MKTADCVRGSLKISLEDLAGANDDRGAAGFPRFGRVADVAVAPAIFDNAGARGRLPLVEQSISWV